MDKGIPTTTLFVPKTGISDASGKDASGETNVRREPLKGPNTGKRESPVSVFRSLKAEDARKANLNKEYGRINAVINSWRIYSGIVRAIGAALPTDADPSEVTEIAREIVAVTERIASRALEAITPSRNFDEPGAYRQILRIASYFVAGSISKAVPGNNPLSVLREPEYEAKILSLLAAAKAEIGSDPPFPSLTDSVNWEITRIYAASRPARAILLHNSRRLFGEVPQDEIVKLASQTINRAAGRIAEYLKSGVKDILRRSDEQMISHVSMTEAANIWASWFEYGCKHAHPSFLASRSPDKGNILLSRVEQLVNREIDEVIGLVALFDDVSMRSAPHSSAISS